MTPADDSLVMQTWSCAWKVAGSFMEEERLTSLKFVSTEQSIANLDSAFRWAMQNAVLSESSGLVEQQALFSKLR